MSGCCDKGGNFENITLKVAGMSCNHCKMAVENALQELVGVERVEVDLDSALVNINYDVSKNSQEDLEKAVVDAGYQVKK